MNKLTIIGNLTRDPELRTTPNGYNVCDFTVAVNRRFGGKNGEESQADFFNVTAWRQTAEFITKFFRKASSICVVGSIQTRTWMDQNGQKRFATEIVADEAYFVDAKSESPIAVQQAAANYGAGAGYGAAPQAQSYVPDGYGFGAAPQVSGGSYANQTAPKFEDISDDEELPF